MSTFWQLVIDIVVLFVLGYFISWIMLPVRLEPLRWLLYVVLVIIAFYVLLPFLGVHTH